MIGYFTFASERSDQHGIYITGNGTYGAPVKRYNFYDIPNRNGRIIGSERKFENIQVTYNAFIKGGSSFESNIEFLRNWLLSTDGYQQLSDSYHPNEFRLAVFEGDFDPDVQENMKDNTFDGAKFALTFNCMPQRFLNSGESVTELTSASTSFLNPTRFDSKPWLKIYGTGQVNVGSRTITISSDYPNSYVEIDCEKMEASYNGNPMNQYVEITSGANTSVDYPVFTARSYTTVSKASSISKVEIKPRWWIV